TNCTGIVEESSAGALLQPISTKRGSRCTPSEPKRLATEARWRGAGGGSSGSSSLRRGSSSRNSSNSAGSGASDAPSAGVGSNSSKSNHSSPARKIGSSRSSSAGQIG